MRKRILFLTSVAVFLFAVYHVYSQSTKSATIAFTSGKNSWKESKNAKWKIVKPGDKITEGSVIRTGNGSRLTLNVEGSEFKLAPNTEIELNSLPLDKKDGKVNVTRGFTWYKMINLKGNQFSVSTPTTTAGVRGTAFSAMYDHRKNESKNCICEGSVNVAGGKEDKPMLLSAGSGASVSKNGKLQEESYKEFIVKMEALPEFKTKIAKSPMLVNCLSCHTPKGWDQKGILRDEKYGK